jgi:ADP-ribose pyrophosphatase YjhB (NUDIX family)
VLDALVRSVAPADEAERADVVEALDWIGRGAPLWRVGHPGDPAGPSPHLVTYTAVVDPDLQAVHLVENRRASKWLVPGGHVRPGEHPEDAAGRKLGQELGLRAPLLAGLSSNPLFVTLADIAARGRHRDVGLWYVFVASITSGIQWDAHHVLRTRWWTLAEARNAHPALIQPALVRFATKLEAELA